MKFQSKTYPLEFMDKIVKYAEDNGRAKPQGSAGYAINWIPALKHCDYGIYEARKINAYQYSLGRTDDKISPIDEQSAQASFPNMWTRSEMVKKWSVQNYIQKWSGQANWLRRNQNYVTEDNNEKNVKVHKVVIRQLSTVERIGDLCHTPGVAQFTTIMMIWSNHFYLRRMLSWLTAAVIS